MSDFGGDGDGDLPVHAFRSSHFAKRLHSPILSVVASLKAEKSDKTLIPLALGDPTMFGNLRVPAVVSQIVAENFLSGAYNGYTHPSGLPSVREAIARSHTTSGNTLDAEDVVVTHGCSGALEIAIAAIVEDGCNVLLPSPGFSQYEMLVRGYGGEPRFYNLLPHRQWQVDIEQLESLADARTTAVVVNNPSNPCGSVYSKAHLADIAAVAERHGIVVVADEIYGELVFEGSTFESMASTSPKVPVFTTTGLSKRFLVPGWRVGWLVLHAGGRDVTELRSAMHHLAQLTLGPAVAIQAAIPRLLDAEESVAQELIAHRQRTVLELQENARTIIRMLGDVPQLQPVEPQGAMYIMIRIVFERCADLKDDLTFAQVLLKEEAVTVLPGKCFGVFGYIRLVCTAPTSILEEACSRLHAFCLRHGNAC